MQTTTGISSLSIAMSENSTATAREGLLGRMIGVMEKTDWDRVIARIDKQISRAGAVALALSALYFTTIFISMLSR